MGLNITPIGFTIIMILGAIFCYMLYILYQELKIKKEMKE